MNSLMNRSTSELNTQLIQQLAWVTQVVGSNNLHAFFILVGPGGLQHPVELEGKMNGGCWIQQGTTNFGVVLS